MTVPYISLATNNTGTSVWIHVVAPTDADYTAAEVNWREVVLEKKNNVSTNQIVSGSLEITQLTEHTLYEVWAHSILNGRLSELTSNSIFFVPAAGSIREKIIDRVASLCTTVLADENTDIVADQIQLGHRIFKGTFRGINGVIVIDGEVVSTESYTSEADLVTYAVTVHVAWSDIRQEDIVEKELGSAAQTLRLLLDQSQDTNIPYITRAQVQTIPFETEFFEGENVRGFALQVDYHIEEYLMSI